MQNNKLSKLIALAVLLGGVTLAPMAEATTGASTNTISGKTITLGSGGNSSNSVSLGGNNVVRTDSSYYSVAIGSNNVSIGLYSVAMGHNVYAGGTGSVAFGEGKYDSSTTASKEYGAIGDYSFVVGYQSKASGTYSVAMGGNTVASGNYSVATGNSSTASGHDSVAMGNGNTASGYASVAMGNASKAWTDGSVALGRSYAGGTSDAASSGATYAFAAGYYSNASGNYSVAMGNGNTASGNNSVAIGAASKAKGNYSVAMGYWAEATPDNSFAFGGTVADGHTASVALGYKSKTGGAYEVSVGSGEEDAYKTRKITNVTSAGTLSDDNNSAATGADVYGATYITDAHNYYDGSSTAVNVKTAVNAVDTAMGKLSANGNYILTSKNVYENIGLLDTKIGALSGTATYNYIAATDTVSANLSALDTRAKTNATAISTNATNITNNATNITNLTTTVGTNTTNISTLQGYFTSGVANEAAKATKDGAGNVIADTYAKTADVSSTYATKTDVSSTYATKTDLSTLSGTVTGYGTSITAIQTYVTASGLNANSQVITNVANGTADSHAVNYSQVKNAYVNATYSSNTLTLTKIDGTTTVINGIGGGSGDTFFEADSGNVKLKTASKITNVNDGTIASGSKEVVTGGQLYTTNQNVTTNANNITTNANNIATNTTNIATNTANIATNASNITAIQGYVKTTGLDANSKVVANVANGTATNDAANLGQLQNYSTVTVAGTNVNTGNGIVIKGGANVSITTSGNEITINATGGGGSVEPGKTSVGTNNNVGTEATNSTAMGTDNTVTGASSTAVGYGNVVTGTGSGAFGDPNNVTGSGSYAFGNDNTINGDNNFVLGNNVTVGGNVTNAVVLGNNSTVTESNVVSVGSETLQRKIVNVAPGENPYDAVNYAQYSDLANNMERRFSKVNEDIGRTGAASAALASLHPQMMRKGESQVMAGMGRYHGKSGAAVGLAWQPHKRVMLSGGFADAAGEIMFNVGASYKFGQHSYTPEQLAEMYNGNGTPLYVAELNAALKSKDVQIMNLKSEFGKAIQTKDVEIQDLRSKVDKLEAMMAELMKMKK